MSQVRSVFIQWLSRTILRQSPDIEKTAFRKLEKVKLKSITNGEHLEFNKQCLQHDLLPTYTYICICIYIYIYIDNFMSLESRAFGHTRVSPMQ